MVKAKSSKVPVSERALIQRINRKLSQASTHGECLKKVRAERGEGISQARLDLGDYYVIDIARNCVIDKHIDLEDYGRQLEVIRDWEELSQ